MKTRLPDVIEVPVWNSLLGSEFLHLIEKDVELILGEEVLQATEAEALNRTVSNEGAHEVEVMDVARQVGGKEG